MSLTKEFILTRARATRDTQFAMQAKWVWDEKAVADWDTAIKAISNPAAAADPTAPPALEDVAAQAEAAYLAAQGTKTATVGRLQSASMQALGLAKVHWRNDPTKLKVLAGCTSKGTTTKAVQTEAEKLEAAWAQLDPKWVPAAGNDYAGYQTLRAQAAQGVAATDTTHQAWSQALTALNTALAQLDDDCVAWFAAAQKALPKNTAEGALIRQKIPTKPPALPKKSPSPAPASVASRRASPPPPAAPAG